MDADRCMFSESGERVGDSSSFIGFVFEIPALSVDVILKDERSATEMFVFCFEKKNYTILIL